MEEKSVEVLLALQSPMTAKEVAEVLGDETNLTEIRKILNAGHQYGLLRKSGGKYEWAEDKKSMRPTDAARRRPARRQPQRRGGPAANRRRQQGQQRRRQYRYGAETQVPTKQRVPKKATAAPHSESEER